MQRWATWTVAVAFDCRYDSHVRTLMPGNPISRQALLAVARARARYADHGTGRNCRPTNERLAADTGYSAGIFGVHADVANARREVHPPS